MLNKEQFDMIMGDMKKDVERAYWKFEDYDGSLEIKINRQLYNDLIEFRETLPYDYFGVPYVYSYDSDKDRDILYDEYFKFSYADENVDNEDLLVIEDVKLDEVDYAFVKVVKSTHYDYRVEFIYNKTKKYNFK